MESVGQNRWRPVKALAILVGGWIASVSPGSAGVPASGTIPIKNVIIIMQENRSFDNYFGTFPHALGLSRTICEPIDPTNPTLGCVKPFYDPHAVNAAGPHGYMPAEADLDDGITTTKFDGFISQQQSYVAAECLNPNSQSCFNVYDGAQRHDVMGYHDAADIPNYWTYAQNFVLQDHLFEGERGYSLPSHLDLASEWSATCTDNTNAATCETFPDAAVPKATTEYPWASLYQLLDVHGVTWKTYVGDGAEPDCNDAQFTCDPEFPANPANVLWNLPQYFGWVKAQGANYLAFHNPFIDQFLLDLKQGTLPQVSWIVPNSTFSEHPPSETTAGMEYVTSLVNAVMQSPYWKSTAVFIAWDDWGGFYDDVAPPNVDFSYDNTYAQGFGLRVPGILISAYAKQGVVDHQVLSFDSYATFFENLFMAGARLDPSALGNPDSRPDLRDAVTRVGFPNGSTAPVGDLMREFDFTQPPRAPLILNTHIPTTVRTSCRLNSHDHEESCTSPNVEITFEPVTGPYIPGPFIYHVTRDGADLPQCTGTATACADTPPVGNHLYQAYSVDPNGVVSPLSGASEADIAPNLAAATAR